jgi:hypothetical protein
MLFSATIITRSPPRTPFAQLRGGGVDGLQQLRAGQAARILDQRDVLRIARGG